MYHLFLLYDQRFSLIISFQIPLVCFPHSHASLHSSPVIYASCLYRCC
jgi:hypothetical protein